MATKVKIVHKNNIKRLDKQHVENILRYQVKKKMRPESCWILDDERFDFIDNNLVYVGRRNKRPDKETEKQGSSGKGKVSRSKAKTS